MRLLLALLLLVACYREKYDHQLTQRLTRIEQRLDALDKAMLELRKRADTTELTALAQRLTALQEMLSELSNALPSGPPPAMTPIKRTPDKAATYAVPLGNHPQAGPATAKVTLVIGLEFDCPFCRRAWDTLEQLRKKYGKDLRIVYKPYVVHFKTAMYPATAACAAHRQGRWRELAQLIWTKAFDVRSMNKDAFAPDRIDALAKQAGLDMTKYMADVTGTCPAEVKDEIALFQKFGVSATPSFFINGRFMEGAKPVAEFGKLIDEELAKATAAQKRGVKPERYYEQEVLAKGLPEAAP